MSLIYDFMGREAYDKKSALSKLKVNLYKFRKS
jgi:hypothetical protein